MTTRTRLIGTLAITILVLGAIGAYTLSRISYWNQRGWIGITFFPESNGRRGKPTPEMIRPGRVLVTIPGFPAHAAGMRVGDEIVSINGIPRQDGAKLRELDARLHTGDAVTYRYRRDAQERQTTVRLASPLQEPRIIASSIVSVTVALAFICIAALVITRQPDDRRARVFYAMTAIGSMSLVASIATGFDAGNIRGIVADAQANFGLAAGYGLLTVAFLPLTLHLALIFPRERPIVVRRPRIIRWLYVVPLAAALSLSGVILVATRLRVAGRLWNGAGSKAVPLVLIGITAVLFVIIGLYPIASCISLYRSYRDAGAEEKRQVKWPLWGTIIALSARIIVTIAGIALGILYSIKPLVFDDALYYLGYADLVPRLTYLLIPISFAFAILKYRLMNIDVIVKRTVVYAILSGTIVALYGLLVGGVVPLLIHVTGVRSTTMIVGSTLVVALVFVPLRNKLQYLVNRNLFRERVDYPQALRTISSLTAEAEDVSQYLTAAAETLQHALQNRAVVVFIQRLDAFTSTAKIGVSDALLGSLRIAVSEPMTTLLARPFNPRNRELPADAAAALRRVEAALVVPMRAGDTLHGFLALASKLSDREYDVDDIDFLTSAAEQMAMALDRIRLQAEESDFTQARDIQRALLPRTLPTIAGIDIAGSWHPARVVGGDYYDVLQLDERRVALAIGDVAGKGMPAALLMSSLQAAVRATVDSAAAPADVCERVRRVVVPNLTGGKFITFFLAIIDAEARTIRFCNAGHNPPLVVHRNGTFDRLERGGPALSRIFREPFTTGEMPLSDGDRIVLFTDGVSEAHDSAGNEFGDDRIAQTVAAATGSAESIQQTVLAAVASFAGGDPEDDLTLVVASVGDIATGR